MLLIAGTVPIKDLPLTVGSPKFQEEFLTINGTQIPCTMGTAALVSAATVTCDCLGVEHPSWITAGDLGEGTGTRHIYNYLIGKLPEISPTVLTLHYMLPIMGLMRKVVESAEKCPKKPILIADAGAMYAVKAAGLAPKFDVLTPDAGEMAFLADPDATHPAYIRRYFFEVDTTEIPRLIEQAYRQGSAPRILLVKNPVDHVAKEGRIIAKISEPNIPTLEPIGGTGDTITGIVSGLISAGYEPVKAAIIAAKANRMAGKFANPTTATKVCHIINQIPVVLKQYLTEWAEGTSYEML